MCLSIGIASSAETQGRVGTKKNQPVRTNGISLLKSLYQFIGNSHKRFCPCKAFPGNYNNSHPVKDYTDVNQRSRSEAGMEDRPSCKAAQGISQPTENNPRKIVPDSPRVSKTILILQRL